MPEFKPQTDAVIATEAHNLVDQIMRDDVPRATPHLSAEVKGMLRDELESNVRDVLHDLANGKTELGNPETHGTLTALFKDNADKKYGGMAIEFDRQGNLVNGYTMEQGTPAGAAATRAFESNKDLKPMLDEGYRVISSAGPGTIPKM